MSEPTEKPILFSGEMVRAILSGRKTQTRRVIKPQPEQIPSTVQPVRGDNGWWWSCSSVRSMVQMREMPCLCPYGKPGDRLWVKETHVYLADGTFAVIPSVGYQADRSQRIVKTLPDGVTVYNQDKPDIWRWRPSIFMPRWASRITLEITDVRVQRLQEIDALDALAEGLSDAHFKKTSGTMVTSAGSETRDDWVTERCEDAFGRLWDAINAKRGHSWESNPWVWAITFRPVSVREAERAAHA